MDSSSLSENDPEIKYWCLYVFDVLAKKLDKHSSISPIFPPKYKGLKLPLFVTWTTGTKKDLRGCIGTFHAGDLEKTLKDYAWIAALEDDRFPPITLKELTKLNVEVSLLHNFEEAKDAYDWTVGTHGIEITFGNGIYNATFLPEGAEEQKWDKKTTLIYLIDKAGYEGELKDVEKSIKLTRYQSLKIYMTYAEYQTMKEGEK